MTEGLTCNEKTRRTNRNILFLHILRPSSKSLSLFYTFSSSVISSLTTTIPKDETSSSELQGFDGEFRDHHRIVNHLHLKVFHLGYQSRLPYWFYCYWLLQKWKHV
ncbi:unnamed protein product [Brassica oleracea var. botrytis]